ncbi:transglutaminase-like domain-containing protein [Clostridium estertheticum]|uniref:transglutaminase-like domain-containing protein n=1 Tax=Clostridium estertheticum TaxID=238834 RepID=UPI0013E983C9|nr:transglutaminase-like domain-containing protein [Clostridium estertheticum]MBZ9689040.1 transglutaminase-like domain-containing protein [Clostridium estertheticum]
MKWIKERLIYIVLIFINFNFILRLLEKGIYIKNFNYGFTSLLFIMGFLIYWFYQCVLRKSSYKILFTLFIFSIGGVYYLIRAYAIKGMLNDYFSGNIITLNDLIYEGSTTYFYQYKIILILLIPLITVLILWVTFRFMKKFILIVTLVAVITLWFSSSYLVVKHHLFIYIFISSLTFIIMSHIKRIQQYKDEGVKVSLKFSYILVYGVIVSLMISKIATILPQEYNGKELTYFGNFFENKFASDAAGTSSANNDRYSLSSSGYNNNEKRLGGPISLDYQEVFKAKSDKPYYLKGNVMDLYDGYKWGKANGNYYKKLFGGDMKFVSYGSSAIGKKNSLTIYPDKKFKTNTIFVPNYAFNFTAVGEAMYYDKAATALSGEVVKEAYSVDFYGYSDVIDTIEDVRASYTKILGRVDYASGNKYFLPMDYLIQPKPKDVNIFINKDTLIEDKFSYRYSEDFKVVKNYGKYLQVPENISKRTYDLVKDITKDAHSSIDKVLQIKNYLTKNYVYDLQVSVIPENSEFVDYFLFKEKKGYCTYFNTAMTVMCRMAGVPSRYVEGFKTPDKKDVSGLYSVSNSDAHAWCEVLLGASEYSNMWTIADASPTASEDMQRKLKALEEEQKSTVNSGNVGINNIRKPKKIIEDIDPAQGASESKVGAISDFQLKAMNILASVILFILMRIIKVLKRRSKLLRSKKVAPLYNYYIYRLGAIRIDKPEDQGDLEFAKKIVNLELKKRMVILVGGSYAEFYGRQSAVGVNNKEYYKFLEGYLKEYEGRFKYLLNKYLGTSK